MVGLSLGVVGGVAVRGTYLIEQVGPHILFHRIFVTYLLILVLRLWALVSNLDLRLVQQHAISRQLSWVLPLGQLLECVQGVDWLV